MREMSMCEYKLNVIDPASAATEAKSGAPRILDSLSQSGVPVKSPGQLPSAGRPKFVNQRLGYPTILLSLRRNIRGGWQSLQGTDALKFQCKTLGNCHVKHLELSKKLQLQWLQWLTTFQGPVVNTLKFPTTLKSSQGRSMWCFSKPAKIFLIVTF